MNAYRSPSPQDSLPVARDTRSLPERYRPLRLALLVVLSLIVVSMRLAVAFAFRADTSDSSLSVYLVVLGMLVAGSVVAYGIMLWDRGTWR